MWAVPLVMLVVLVVHLSSATPVFAASDEKNSAGTDADVKLDKHFVVTLRSSFTPISDKQAKRDFPDSPVYLIQSKAFDKTVYLVRVGFFKNYADAMVFRESAVAKYPAAQVSEITSNEFLTIQRTLPAPKPAAPTVTAKKIEPQPAPSVPPAPVPVPAPSVAPAPIPVPAPRVAPAPTPVPAPPVRAGAYSPKALFAILLEENDRAAPAVRAPLPASLKNYRLYTTQTRDKKKTLYQLKLGFFENEKDVYAARKQMQEVYTGTRVVRVSLSEQSNSIQTALSVPAALPPVAAPVPVPKVSPGAVAKVPVPTPTLPAAVPEITPSAAAGPASSYDRDALALFEKSRAALARGDNTVAIATLDQLLRLPPNRYSQDAQELIGLSRQRAGETVAARKEYELYLRLYPTGEGSDRVRQRVAALEVSTTTTPPPELKAVKPRMEAQSTIVGNLSQYYYHGASRLDTTTLTPPANAVNLPGLTQTDQSSLVTSLNFTHRYRSEDYDNRLVIRDTFTKNFLQGQDDTNRPSDIYYELKDRKLDYSARLGRQPGGSGGVLGRFEGLLAGYNFSPKWRINVVGGVPTDISNDSHLKFLGTGIDIGPYAENWGGSLYTMVQKVDDVTDRHAVGGELRYFSQVFTLYGLFDYDTEFKTSNIALVQGNWTATSGTTVHALFDRRKTPSLSLTNALIGESDTSIKSQLQTKTYEQLKQQALDLTSTTDLYNAGISQPLSTRWQAGFDVQSAHTSSTVGSVNQPAQPDTGTIYTYTANLIGNGIFTQRDVNVISISHIAGETLTGDSYSLTNRLLWGPSWALDTTLNWYTSHDSSTNTDVERFSPSLKPSYKWKQNITLEAEFGEESTTSRGTLTEDTTRRRYWSLGYRWDF
jgi:tetratricopeptide (TPR) repeat protein